MIENVNETSSSYEKAVAKYEQAKTSEDNL